MNEVHIIVVYSSSLYIVLKYIIVDIHLIVYTHDVWLVGRLAVQVISTLLTCDKKGINGVSLK